MIISVHSIISGTAVCQEDFINFDVTGNRLNFTDKRYSNSLNYLFLVPEFHIFSLLSPPSFPAASLSVSLPPSSHPFCFTERLTFCSSPKAYCPIHLLSNLSPSLAIVVIVLSLTFSSRSCLHHHPGTLIYKLAAKARPTPLLLLLLLLLLLQQKTERWRDSSGESERQEGEESTIGEDLIC